MILGFLLKLARLVVQGVLNTIKNQVNMVLSAVTQPLQAIVSQVTNGAWKGDGAVRFVEEMQTQVLPALQNLGMGFTNTGSMITRAMDTIYRADTTASRIANGLGDLFGGIFH